VAVVADPEDAPPDLKVRDATVMRALAHPARFAILEQLFGGAARTATELAEVVGMSPSATSYHLRALAKANLVQEAPSRGDGRERVWQTSIRGLDISAGPTSTPAAQAADHEVTSMLVDLENARIRDWIERRASETQEWYDASGLAEMRLLVTAEELDELNKKVMALLLPYGLTRRAKPPPGARNVYVTYRSFPA
jgi:DNA-binding transcriptional ArsR family regulator